MYWRIIRINGDGSVRIIYDGTQAYANGAADNARYAIIRQAWNSKYNDAKYGGWMFGGTQGTASTSKEQAQTNETSSDAKTAVDNWYKENIVNTGYVDNVADVLFCNDRTTPGKAATGLSTDTGLGYARNTTAYGAFARLYSDGTNGYLPTPKFTCEVKNDSFTVNENENGNGALTYPVGLITADEVVAAGGRNGAANTSYYLYKSISYYGWLLSPYVATVDGSSVSFTGPNNSLDASGVTYTNGALAPVINLNADYAMTLTGDGSMTNPYVGA